jgi:hypothetical protein
LDGLEGVDIRGDRIILGIRGWFSRFWTVWGELGSEVILYFTAYIVSAVRNPERRVEWLSFFYLLIRADDIKVSNDYLP